MTNKSYNAEWPLIIAYLYMARAVGPRYTQIAKMSIRYRSDAKVSARYLIDVDTRVFAVL